jgi:hypothetical protein
MKSIESMEMSRFYFSYGDFGSIVGRMSNFYGMKFGDSGLWCDVYEQTLDPTLAFDVRKTIGKVILSTNPGEICDFFGYNYDIWKIEIPKLMIDTNFLTNYSPKLDENCEKFPDIPKSHKFIFDWLISSRFFDSRMFLFLNADHRRRHDLRPFYMNFLKYIGIADVGKASAMEGESGGVDRNLQLEAIHHFKKGPELDALLKDVNRKKAHQSKFSGAQLIVRFKKHLGIELKDKEIGPKISLFKQYCTERSKCESWEEFLDNHDKNLIDEFLDNFVTASHF